MLPVDNIDSGGCCCCSGGGGCKAVAAVNSTRPCMLGTVRRHPSALLSQVADRRVYFVHSYHATPSPEVRARCVGGQGGQQHATSVGSGHGGSDAAASPLCLPKVPLPPTLPPSPPTPVPRMPSGCWPPATMAASLWRRCSAATCAPRRCGWLRALEALVCVWRCCVGLLALMPGSQALHCAPRPKCTVEPRTVLPQPPPHPPHLPPAVPPREERRRWAGHPAQLPGPRVCGGGGGAAGGSQQ